MILTPEYKALDEKIKKLYEFAIKHDFKQQYMYRIDLALYHDFMNQDRIHGILRLNEINKLKY